MTHTEWINARYPSAASALGQCASATTVMSADFPELRRVRGHYVCPYDGRRTHWWMVDKAGAVVDPTARQFLSAGGGDYQPRDESIPEPVGRCIECGGLVAAADALFLPTCSAACSTALGHRYNGK